MQLKSFTRPVILWSLLGLLFLTVLIAVFIFGLPWRWAIDQRIAAIQAKGEPICLRDLKPKAIPDSENGVPLLQDLWRDIASSQGKLWHDCDGYVARGSQEDLAIIRFNLGLSSAPPSTKPANSLQIDINHFLDLQKLLASHPDLLERWEAALAKPSFQFSVDYDHGPEKLQSWDSDFWRLCRSANFLNLLSRYHVVIGDRSKAQRSRLAILQLFRVCDEIPADRSMANINHQQCYGSFVVQLPFMNEAEIIQAQKISDGLRPCAFTSKQHMLADRAFLFDIMNASHAQRSALTGGHMTYQAKPDEIDLVREFFYQNTAWRHLDFLHLIDGYQDLLDGKPLPITKCYWFNMIPDFSLREKMEGARYRQFQLALEIERLQRHEGRYPADLKGIPFPSWDAYGKPMTYEVFENGKAARLILQDQGVPHSFNLGEIPDNPKP